MNDAHFHLLVNHLPIIFPIVGILTLACGLIFKAEALKRMAYLIFFLGALSCIFAMNSGEGAEELIEGLGRGTESYIEQHEETAELFSILSYALGALSLLGLWASFKASSFAKQLSYVVLAASLVVIYFAKETGTTGGEISHTEIRSGSALPAQSDGEEKEADDD